MFLLRYALTNLREIDEYLWETFSIKYPHLEERKDLSFIKWLKEYKGYIFFETPSKKVFVKLLKEYIDETSKFLNINETNFPKIASEEVKFKPLGIHFTYEMVTRLSESEDPNSEVFQQSDLSWQPGNIFNLLPILKETFKEEKEAIEILEIESFFAGDKDIYLTTEIGRIIRKKLFNFRLEIEDVVQNEAIKVNDMWQEVFETSKLNNLVDNLLTEHNNHF